MPTTTITAASTTTAAAMRKVPCSTTMRIVEMECIIAARRSAADMTDPDDDENCYEVSRHKSCCQPRSSRRSRSFYCCRLRPRCHNMLSCTILSFPHSFTFPKRKRTKLILMILCLVPLLPPPQPRSNLSAPASPLFPFFGGGRGGGEELRINVFFFVCNETRCYGFFAALIKFPALSKF
jgi:hypothetical protein